MVDALRDQAERLLTTYMEYSTSRELGNTMQAPSVCPPSMSPPFVHMLYMSGTSVHAATMLCSVSPCAAAQLTLLGLLNRLLRNHQLVTQIAQDILAGCHSLSSVLMVALYTFAGTLLQWPPPGTNVSSRATSCTWRNELAWTASAFWPCYFLGSQGQQHSWLEAYDSWYGFCLFFTPLLPSFLEKSAGPGSSIILQQ